MDEVTRIDKIISFWSPDTDVNRLLLDCRREITNLRELQKSQMPSEWVETLEGVVSHIEKNTCQHENTHRGGFLWEICDDCGEKWADDQGGKPEFRWPVPVERARKLLAKVKASR